MLGAQILFYILIAFYFAVLCRVKSFALDWRSIVKPSAHLK